MEHDDDDVEDGLYEMPFFDDEIRETRNMEEPDGIDRISDMPDDVLSKILCFMPTKNVVAAKILSTRWGRLFPFIWVPPIVIDLEGTSYVSHRCGLSRSFEVFVDKLLLKQLNNLHVLNLNIQPWHSDEKKLQWVSAALRLNVRELSLQLYMWEPKDLFPVLNGYTGLVKLEFCRFGRIDEMTLPNGFVLPNLRTLVVSELTFSVEEDGCSLPNLRTLLLSELNIYSLNKFINSLALEVLSFKSCVLNYRDSSSFCLSIQCPSLKNLTIEDCTQMSECSLAIDAPRLQVLLCKGFAAASYDVGPFNSLISAHIDVEFPYSANGIEGLFEACSSAVDLYLSAFVMEALHVTRAQLPMLKNLNRLALGHIQLSGWVILARLLCNSPNLEKITFKQVFCLHDGGYSSFESLMTSNPTRLELCVKEIEFLVFDEQEDEIKLVEYFRDVNRAGITLPYPYP